MRIISGLADDRWHRLTESAAYEWWYFDALAADGRTAFVFIWFAGLPFSPDALTDHEAGRVADPLDHVALFTGVYEDGKQVAYALNRYDRSQFEAATDELRVRVGTSVARSGGGGRPSFEVAVDTPLMLGGKRLVAALTFRPLVDPLELDFGSSGAPSDHVWNPVAPDCTVEGHLEIQRAQGSPSWNASFRGRGYHDHNYGTRPLTEGIRRWHWGRVHIGDTAFVYYDTEPEAGETECLLAGFDRGKPILVSNDASFAASGWRRRILCPKYPEAFDISGGVGGSPVHLSGRVRHVVDWGPFYMRFLTDFSVEVGGERAEGLGISEYLDPRGLRNRLYRPLIKTRIRRVG